MATFSLDLESDTCDLTPALRMLWGLDESATRFRLNEFLERVHPDDRQRVADARSQAIRTHNPYHIEYRMIRANGDLRYLRSDGQFIYDANGRAVRNIGAMLDITDQANAQLTIDHLLGHDKLTGLLDRDRFLEQVHIAASPASKSEPFVVAVFNLDRFTAINESFGSSGGDTLLKAVGERLADLALDGEAFGRIGGDEFAGLLRRDGGDADAGIARVRAILEEPVAIGAAKVTPAATFGTSVFPNDASDESLVVKACLAMAQLKNRGTQGAAHYHPEMERMLAERRHLQMSLHGALDRNEFELYLQPIVEARSLAVCGAELLLRWNHPSLGVVPPGAFLPAAEDAGLSQAIDMWVLRRALREAATIGVSHGIRICFNITAHSLLSTSFASALGDALAERSIASGTLVAEITEQALLADHAQARASLSLLNEAGVSIALDDFGTGYNTLSYLRMFPISTIKIDRSFVADIERYAYSRSVCAGILAFASQLGLRVVAEGVETEGQQEFLRSTGVDMLQGFLYGRPMRRAQFEDVAKSVRPRALDRDISYR